LSPKRVQKLADSFHCVCVYVYVFIFVHIDCLELLLIGISKTSTFLIDCISSINAHDFVYYEFSLVSMYQSCSTGVCLGLQSGLFEDLDFTWGLERFSPLMPTVATWVQLYSILCQTGLSRHL